MDTLIVNVPGRGTRGPSLIRCTDGSLSLGRGFQNDIVLDDPFVAAEQLRFVRDDRGWTVTVLERTNPVLLNGNPLREPEARLTSGDQLTVGRTDLSVYDETHPVDPPRRLALSSWLSAHRVGPGLALMVLFVGGGLDALVEFATQSTDLDWQKHAYDVVFSASFIAVWAAVWALLGRALRHQPHYFAHLLVSAFASFAMTLLLPLAALAEFISSSERIGELATFGVAILGLAVLLGFNLFLATNLRRTARVAVLFSVCIAGLVYLGSHHEDETYQAEPVYSALVLPPLLHVTGERSIEDFINGVAPAPTDD